MDNNIILDFKYEIFQVYNLSLTISIYSKLSKFENDICLIYFY